MTQTTKTVPLSNTYWPDWIWGLLLVLTNEKLLSGTYLYWSVLAVFSLLDFKQDMNIMPYLPLSSDAFKEHAWILICVLETRPAILFYLSIYHGLVIFQSHFTVSWHVLLLSSPQWNIQPELIRDQSIDFQAHRKKKAVACHPTQRYWVCLINTYWLFYADCFLLMCSVLFTMSGMKCVYVIFYVTVETKCCPGTFVLAHK